VDQVPVDTTKTVSVNLGLEPDDQEVMVYVYHEFGDLVTAPSLASRTASGVYELLIGTNEGGTPILNSAGKYRCDFKYKVSSNDYTKSVYLNVYTPYATDDVFFNLYPELEVQNSSKFETFESRARAVINTYCGQSFDSYLSKKVIVNGNNHNVLHLPFPISRLERVVMDEGDIGEAVIYDGIAGVKTLEKIRQPSNFNSTYYIRFKRGSGGISDRITEGGVFKESSSYSITGDWGWPYVPEPVTQACNLLVADFMNDDGEYRKHGIVSVDMDNIRFSMKSSFYESTGNIEADVLLTDYTLFVMDYII
jgi:hypothetical protein